MNPIKNTKSELRKRVKRETEKMTGPQISGFAWMRTVFTVAGSVDVTTSNMTKVVGIRPMEIPDWIE